MRLFFAGCAALLLVLGGYLQYELRSIGDRDRAGEQWRDVCGTDFAVYYVAGRIAGGEGDGRLYVGAPNASIKDDASPWVRVAQRSGVCARTPFQYPPFFALLIRPLTVLPLKQAYFVWRQISAVLVLAAIFLTLVLAHVQRPFVWLIGAAAATFASFPLIEMKEMGQVGGLILFLWALGAYFADKRRPVAGAFCFALGTMIKLTPAVVVPLLILRRQWKWLLAYAVWIVTFLLIGIWQLGWSNHIIFFTQFMPAMACGAPSAANKSLMNVIQSLYSMNAFHDASFVSIPDAVCDFGKVVSASVLGFVLFLLDRRAKSAAQLPYEIALLALVSLLISPVSWRHHYVLAVLPLLLMWTAPDDSKWRWPLLFGATVLIGSPVSHALVARLYWPILQVCASMLMPAAAVIAVCLGVNSNAASVADSSDEAAPLPDFA